MDPPEPGAFAQITAKRVLLFWAGIPRSEVVAGFDIRDLSEAAFFFSSALAFVGLLLCSAAGSRTLIFAVSLPVYPVIYYLTFPHERYRHPIEPLIVLLALYPVAEAFGKQTQTTKPLIPVTYSTPKKISIIIPVFNERNTIENVIATVSAVNIPLEKEIIIVDDFSTDGTRELLPAIESNSAGRVRVLLHEKNHGKGYAIRTGLAADHRRPGAGAGCRP